MIMIVNSYFGYLHSCLSCLSNISGFLTNARKIVKIENILIVFQLIIFMLIKFIISQVMSVVGITN